MRKILRGLVHNSERRSIALDSDLVIRVGDRRNTFIMRCVSQKTATALEDGPFLIAVTALFRVPKLAHREIV